MRSIKSGIKKRNGFILYEAVISLMITLMTLGILQQALQIMRVIQQTSIRNSLTWHITNERLQDTFGHDQIRQVSEHRIIFHHDGLTRKIDMGGTNNLKTLRISTADQNNSQTIMTHLKKIKIEKIQNLVIITTVNDADEQSEMYLTNDE